MTTLLALLIAVQPAPALVEKADQASQAYIGCLFATSREAHGSRLPLAEFKRKHGIERIVDYIAEDFDDPLPEDFLFRPLP